MDSDRMLVQTDKANGRRKKKDEKQSGRNQFLKVQSKINNQQLLTAINAQNLLCIHFYQAECECENNDLQAKRVTVENKERKSV